ncbi:predicted protein [Lichtheimia corymbifera JMRC:FSU:9682]|uniref:Uncharacterized protein n=1 Tax=Lichtheimia corymbifera JMRC:FSU:9682 TaxID=1263082 RepID=A0A068S3G1_9FUNG|nr:predicted protein [Lichtheimia corymbifera JMRC:FSU:9682]
MAGRALGPLTTIIYACSSYVMSIEPVKTAIDRLFHHFLVYQTLLMDPTNSQNQDTRPSYYLPFYIINPLLLGNPICWFGIKDT